MSADINILSDRRRPCGLDERNIRSPGCSTSWPDRQSDVRSDDCPKRGRPPRIRATDKYRNYKETFNFSNRTDSGTRPATAGV